MTPDQEDRHESEDIPALVGESWTGRNPGNHGVTNADIQLVESPDRWKVLKVFVGESGLPLNMPSTSMRDDSATEDAQS